MRTSTLLAFIVVLFLLFLGVGFFFGFSSFSGISEPPIGYAVPVSEDTNPQDRDRCTFKSGDIIFQMSPSPQSEAIQIATKSKWSHVGIIFEEDGDFYVYEAVQPVSITRLSRWIRHGIKESYAVARLKNADEILTPEVITQMKEVGRKYEGDAYDIYFEWSDKRSYCSELVWKIYKQALDIEISETRLLGDFDLTHPIVKAKLKERYGSNIPMDETVVSPADLYNSDKLEVIDCLKK